MTVRRFVHTNIVVADIEKALEVYVGLLGGKLLRRMEPTGAEMSASMGLAPGATDDWAAALVYFADDRNGPYIDLLEWRGDNNGGAGGLGMQSRGIVRIALEVDDVEAYEQKVKAAGLECLGPIMHDVVSSWDVRALFFKDHDGAIIELVDFPKGYKGQPDKIVASGTSAHV